MRRGSHSAFTLLEMIAAVVVMSIIASVVMPLIVSSTDAYSVTKQARGESERALYALERLQRLVRETPWMSDDSGIGFTAADSGSLTLESGVRVRLDTDRLVIRDAAGAEHDLCTGVTTFVIRCYDASGDEMAVIMPNEIHRVGIELACGSTTLSTYAMPRAWIGRETP